MAKINIGSSPKMVREALCYAQQTVDRIPGQGGIAGLALFEKGEQTIELLQELIDQIDTLRPLGPDGKHGDRHTPECGCEVTCVHCGQAIKLIRGFGIAWEHIQEDGSAKWAGMNCDDWRTSKNIAEPSSWTTDVGSRLMTIIKEP